MSSLPPVILTREEPDNQRLKERLETAGFPVLECPCVATEIHPCTPDTRICQMPLSDFDAVVFSSRRGVRGMESTREVLKSIPLWAGVGEATAQQMEDRLGRQPDLVPESGTGEEMVRLLVEQLPRGSHVLLVRGDKTTGIVQKGLRESGMTICEVTVYRNVAPDVPRLAPGGSPVLVFASPSAARRFFDVNPHLKTSATVAIGPTTADALGKMGCPRVNQAKQPNEDELFESILRIKNEETK